jgi:hypothetical protein
MEYRGSELVVRAKNIFQVRFHRRQYMAGIDLADIHEG